MGTTASACGLDQDQIGDAMLLCQHDLATVGSWILELGSAN